MRRGGWEVGRRRGCREENLRELEPEDRSSGKRRRGVGKRREQGRGGKGRGGVEGRSGGRGRSGEGR